MSFEAELEETMSKISYTDADKYWSSVPATVNGMLGGFEALTERDISSSRAFILPFISGLDSVPLESAHPLMDPLLACDCGAGIGRVSKFFLLPLFAHVHLLEQNKHLLDASTAYLQPETHRTTKINLGLQSFDPSEEEGAYDLIWLQWVIGYLDNTALTKFLIRSAKGLKPNGYICIKDNFLRDLQDTTATDTRIIFDAEDSSITRCRSVFLQIIAIANLKIIAYKKQDDFPTNIYPVWMYLLRPL